VLALFLTAAGGLLLAVPAAAATIDCTPMGDPACRDLTPVVECVWLETNGSRTVVWGYDNPSTDTLHIDIGNKNGMSPADGNQPTEFVPGRKLNVFTTNVPGTNASWRLGNNSASLSSGTAKCLTKPVSMIGDVTALGIFLLLFAVAVPFAVRPRKARVTARPVWGAQ
jgi:hypothetical protein